MIVTTQKLNQKHLVLSFTYRDTYREMFDCALEATKTSAIILMRKLIRVNRFVPKTSRKSPENVRNGKREILRPPLDISIAAACFSNKSWIKSNKDTKFKINKR